MDLGWPAQMQNHLVLKNVNKVNIVLYLSHIPIMTRKIIALFLLLKHIHCFSLHVHIFFRVWGKYVLIFNLYFYNKNQLGTAQNVF